MQIKVSRTGRARRRFTGLLFLAALFVSCGEESAVPSLAESDVRVPRQVLENTVMRQTSLRGLLWVLSADRATSYSSEEPTVLEELHIDFYDGHDTIQSVLTSRFGSIDAENSTLIAEESVVVETAEGDRLETEFLEWDPETERVTTPNPFTLYRLKDVVTGVGIDADPGLTDYTIRSELRAVMRDDPDWDALEGNSK